MISSIPTHVPVTAISSARFRMALVNASAELPSAVESNLPAGATALSVTSDDVVMIATADSVLSATKDDAAVPSAVVITFADANEQSTVCVVSAAALAEVVGAATADVRATPTFEGSSLMDKAAISTGSTAATSDDDDDDVVGSTTSTPAD